MKITDKITSKEELLEVIGSATYRQIYHDLCNQSQFTTTVESKVHWWAIREQYRLRNSVYETTDALTALNNHRNMFAHISSEDRNMVAFTPDAVFGASDRQLRMSFGKLLTRLIPFASDDYIRDLTAWHLADLSNEVEWVEGLDIAELYSRDNNTGACMSNKTTFEVQPTVAYAAPGVKMAVLRNPDGTLKARAMVVENTDKKVFIRAYGDPLLRKRLERLGYKVGTWEGVKFNTVFLEPSELQKSQGINRVVIPYLDGKGTTCSQIYSSVALIDQQLVCLTENQQSRLTVHKPGYTKVPSTAGFVELRNIESTSFQVKDEITGKACSTLLDRLHEFASLSEDGKQKFGYLNLDDYEAYITDDDSEAAAGENTDFEYPELVKARVLKDTVFVRAYAKLADTFNHRYERYLNDIETRKYCGFYRLSQKYYPESFEDWTTDTVEITDSLGVAHRIKRADAVNVISLNQDSQPVLVRKHVSETVKGMVRLHTYNSIKCFAQKDVEIFRTPSGAKVHPLHNLNIVKTFEGYDFDRNVKRSEIVLFDSFMYSKGTDLTSKKYVDHVNALFESQFERALQTVNGNLMKLATRLLGISSSSRIYSYGARKHFTSSHYADQLWTNKPIEFQKEVLQVLLEHYTAAKWQRAAIKKIQLMVAEAEAVEQPTKASAVEIDIDKPAKVVIVTVDERYALTA